MSYQYKLMSYPEVYADLRGVFGVDNLVLSDELADAITEQVNTSVKKSSASSTGNESGQAKKGSIPTLKAGAR
jgi:hypothetical protein